MLVLTRKKNESVVIGPMLADLDAWFDDHVLHAPQGAVEKLRIIQTLLRATLRITVVEIRGDKVRLGITAPREIDVHRQEVWEQIHGKRQGQDDVDRASSGM